MRRPVDVKHTLAFFFLSVSSHSARPPLLSNRPLSAYDVMQWVFETEGGESETEDGPDNSASNDDGPDGRRSPR